MTVVKKKREEKRRSRSRWCRSFDRKRSGLQVSLANVSRVGNARKKKAEKKNLLAPYFSTRRRYKTRRDTAGLLVRANESSSSKTLRKGGSERKTQSSLSLSLSRAYRCRAGRLERIRPYLNGSLSLFPSSSSLTTAPPSKHTHTHTLPTTPSHTSSLANSQPSSFLGNASPFSLSACIKTTHVCV